MSSGILAVGGCRAEEACGDGSREQPSAAGAGDEDEEHELADAAGQEGEKCDHGCSDDDEQGRCSGRQGEGRQEVSWSPVDTGLGDSGVVAVAALGADAYFNMSAEVVRACVANLPVNRKIGLREIGEDFSDAIAQGRTASKKRRSPGSLPELLRLTRWPSS